MLSLCHKFWQVLLAQGIVYGIGAAGLFLPGIVATGQWFSSKRGLATGLVASGSSVGMYMAMYGNNGCGVWLLMAQLRLDRWSRLPFLGHELDSEARIPCGSKVHCSDAWTSPGHRMLLC